MKKIGSIIILTDKEQEVCKEIAMARTRSNRESGVSNKKFSEESDFKIDLEGFAAEFAFCKLFNISPDMTVQPRSSANDSGDCVLHGLKVDVKSTVHKNGHLLVAPWKKHTVDIYALMIGQFPEYEFRGFLPASEMLSEKRLQDFYSHKFKTYRASQRELVEFYELWLFT